MLLRQLDSGCRSFVCKKDNGSKSAGFVKVYNTLSNSRKELIAINLPTELQAKILTVFNAKNQNIKTERSGNILYCEVEIPAFGYTTLRLEECSKPENSFEFKGVSLLMEIVRWKTITTELYLTVKRWANQKLDCQAT